MDDDTTKTMTEADYKAFHKKHKRELTAADIAQYFEEDMKLMTAEEFHQEHRNLFPDRL